MAGQTLDYAQILKVSVEAAKAAGAEIAAAFTQPKSVSHKGKVDLVTETDQKCEALILEKLMGAYPDFKFIGEEGSAAQGSTDELTDAPTWMVDPLDGTTNFIHRQPNVCVSIGLTVEKQVVVGVVYNPITNELFTAVRSEGSALNGKALKVAEESDLGSGLLITEIGVGRDQATVEAVFDRVANATQATRAVRCMGSCAMDLCSVAAARGDIFFEIGFGGPWDVAAGALILTEAGGVVIDPAGGPFDVMGRRVLGGNNAKIAQALAAVIKGSKLSPKEPKALVVA